MKTENCPEWIPAICGICPYNCEVLVQKENGKIIKVKADPDAPYGNLCPRGMLAPEIVYHENRIRYPMIRTGEKGEGKFRRVSWEEALNKAAEGFRKCMEEYGTRSLASYSGASSLEDSLCDVGENFFYYLGSPNDMSSGSICFVPSRTMGPQLSLGLYGHELRADLEHSDVIFLWGSNPSTDSGKGNYQKILDLHKKGTKIVVVDPMGSKITQIADCWIRIRPGTDGAFLSAMAKRMIQKKTYDCSFVENYTSGFEEFQEKMEGYSEKELLQECGIKKEDFEQAYTMFSESTAVSVLFYTGLEYQPSGIQTIRLLYIMWAIGGKLDVPGGLLIRGSKKETFADEKQKNELPIGAEKYPVFYRFTGRGQFGEFPRAVLDGKPYPIRGFLVYGASPALSYPGGDVWKEVYRKLDMMVVMERSWSEECAWADVIFPATTYYENLSYCYYKDRVRIREKIIEPVGESKNDVIILHDLAEKLGFGSYFPKSEEEILKRAFHNDAEQIGEMKKRLYGITKEPEETVYLKYEKGILRKDGEKGFPTPSGKVEILSTVLKEYGYEPLPVYEPVRRQEGYPYILMTGARSRYHYNSYGLSYKKLVEQEKEPAAEIDISLAEKIQVRNGDMVRVETTRGMLELPVRICSMAENTVHIAVGGGGRFQISPWDKTNVNELCDLYQRDPVSGFVTCKSVNCNIYKI